MYTAQAASAAGCGVVDAVGWPGWTVVVGCGLFGCELEESVEFGLELLHNVNLPFNGVDLLII